jgi:hypothetical protein
MKLFADYQDTGEPAFFVYPSDVTEDTIANEAKMYPNVIFMALTIEEED